MRFRFCGDLDCPDWLLAEISTLSKITSIKVKLLCAQVLKNLIGGEIDYEKVYKLTADAKFDTRDVKACLAALRFILTSAAKYSIGGDSLTNELQQLGLPKEHTTALVKAYMDNLEKLQEQFKKESLRLSQLDSLQWRVDYIVASSELDSVNEPSIQLKFHIKNPDTCQVEPVLFAVTHDKFRLLLADLKQAHSMMENLVS